MAQIALGVGGVGKEAKLSLELAFGVCVRGQEACDVVRDSRASR